MWNIFTPPQALRDANEKIFAANFAACCPETLVTRDAKLLHAFISQHHQAVLKPLHSMGGGSIFLLRKGDPNINVVIETLTALSTQYIMAQRFIPEIAQGDKRILLIDGEPIPYALARIPAKGEIRGNLAAGGYGEGRSLTERDYWICQQVGPTLRAMGLLLVGLDVIGDYLTEINVTSPTCIRQLDAQFKLNISSKLFDSIEQRLKECR
jgi:glutathione synthase